MKTIIKKLSAYVNKHQNKIIYVTFVMAATMVSLIISKIYLNFPLTLDLLSLLSQWLLVVAGIFVPIMIFKFQSKLEKDKEETKKSNVLLLKEIVETNNRINNMFNLKEAVGVITKDEIFKFVSISMSATSKEIADHFKVPTAEIKEQLIELAMVDRKIKTFLNFDPRSPTEETIWFRA